MIPRMPLRGSATVPLAMTTTRCFSQRDPRWESDYLGASRCTMASDGCLVSVMASILGDLVGSAHTPGTLNAWLRSHGGYVNGNRFIFSSVAPLGVELASLIACDLSPAPMDVLERALSLGAAIAVQVDFNPGGAVQGHWVRLLSGLMIMDPWPRPPLLGRGDNIRHLQLYYAKGWDASRSIFRAAVYTKAKVKA